MSAFQAGAFQTNAFQIEVTAPPFSIESGPYRTDHSRGSTGNSIYRRRQRLR